VLFSHNVYYIYIYIYIVLYKSVYVQIEWIKQYSYQNEKAILGQSYTTTTTITNFFVFFLFLNHQAEINY